MHLRKAPQKPAASSVGEDWEEIREGRAAGGKETSGSHYDSSLCQGACGNPTRLPRACHPCACCPCAEGTWGGGRRPTTTVRHGPCSAAEQTPSKGPFAQTVQLGGTDLSPTFSSVRIRFAFCFYSECQVSGPIPCGD